MRFGWKCAEVREHAAPMWKYIAAVSAMIFLCVLLMPIYRCRAEELQAATMMEATKKVNIRSEPDAKSKVLGQLDQGERIYAVELTAGGWYRVVYQGEPGYIKSSYLKIYSADEWDASEDPGSAGLQGEVIDPEEEVRKAAEKKAAAKKEAEETARKAAEEAARKEAEEDAGEEAEEAARKESAADAQAAKEKEAADIKTRSRQVTIGVFAGALLLIAVYSAYTIAKEKKGAGQPGKDGKNAEKTQGSAEAGSRPGHEGNEEIEFLDLGQEEQV